MKEEIFNIIAKFLEAKYEIQLSKNQIIIKEIYKSISSDKWSEKIVYESCGLSYFEEGTLRITLEHLRKIEKEILTN
jgi:hypothetical protein